MLTGLGWGIWSNMDCAGHMRGLLCPHINPCGVSLHQELQYHSRPHKNVSKLPQ